MSRRRVIPAREWDARRLAADVTPTPQPQDFGEIPDARGRYTYEYLGQENGRHRWSVVPADAPASMPYRRRGVTYYDPARATIGPHPFDPDSQMVTTRGTQFVDPSTTSHRNDRVDYIDVPQGMLWRGMSAEEYQDAKQRGYFESKGDHNLGDEQIGQTFFSALPSSAANYASGFAPWQYKPTFTRPAYVVGIPDRPDAPRGPLGNEPSSHEVGLRGRIPFSEVQHTYVGTPHEISPGEIEVCEDLSSPTGWSRPSVNHPSPNLRWEPLAPESPKLASIFPPHDEDIAQGSIADDPIWTPENAKWYHVTRAPMQPGEKLRPFGGERGYGNVYDMDPRYRHRDQHVWMEHDPWTLEEHWAHPERTPYIYEVEPHEKPQPWNGTGSEGWVADGATVKRQISDNGWLPMDFTAALTDPRYVDPAYFAGTHEMGHALDFAGDFESMGKIDDVVSSVWQKEHPDEKPPWGPGDPRLMQWLRSQLPRAAFQQDEWDKGNSYLNPLESLAHAFTEVRLNPQANDLSKSLHGLLGDSLEYAPPHGNLSVGPGVPQGFTDAIADVQADHPQADISRINLSTDDTNGPAWMSGPGPYAQSDEAGIPPRMQVDQQYADPATFSDWMDEYTDKGHYPRWESTTAAEPWPEDQIADFGDEYDRDMAHVVHAALNQPLVDQLYGEFRQWHTEANPGYDDAGDWTPGANPNDVERGPIGDWKNVENFLKAKYPAAHRGHAMGLERAKPLLDVSLDPEGYDPQTDARGWRRDESGRVVPKTDPDSLLKLYESGPEAVAKYGYDPAEVTSGMVLLHNQSHPFRGDMAQEDQDRLVSIFDKRMKMQRDHDARQQQVPRVASLRVASFPEFGIRHALITDDTIYGLSREFTQWARDKALKNPRDEGLDGNYKKFRRGPVGHWPYIEQFMKEKYPAAYRGLEYGHEEARALMDATGGEGEDDHPSRALYNADPYETGPEAHTRYGYDPKETAAAMLLLHNDSHPGRQGWRGADTDRLIDIMQKRMKMQRDYESSPRAKAPGAPKHDDVPSFVQRFVEQDPDPKITMVPAPPKPKETGSGWGDFAKAAAYEVRKMPPINPYDAAFGAGLYRLDDPEPVSTLEWDRGGEVKMIRTRPEFRAEHGLATQLFDHAKEHFDPELHHSELLSPDGAAWAKKTYGWDPSPGGADSIYQMQFDASRRIAMPYVHRGVGLRMTPELRQLIEESLDWGDDFDPQFRHHRIGPAILDHMERTQSGGMQDRPGLGTYWTTNPDTNLHSNAAQIGMDFNQLGDDGIKVLIGGDWDGQGVHPTRHAEDPQHGEVALGPDAQVNVDSVKIPMQEGYGRGDWLEVYADPENTDWGHLSNPPSLRRAFIDGPDGFIDVFADPDGTGVWKTHVGPDGRETTTFIQAPHVTPVDYDDPPLTTPW